MKINSLLLSVLVLAAPVANAWAEVSVTNLRTEMKVDPIGIDDVAPRLSWQITSDKQNVMQTSYRIIVASSQELLDKNKGDLWDSQVVSTDRCNFIDYAGKRLTSGQRALWKVVVNTNKGKATSQPASWQAAIMDSSEWEASWIGRSYPTDILKDNTKVRARYLRKEFSVNSGIKKATLYICGLGLYEASINGNRVGNAVLAPTPTEYDKSVRYNTYDVTNLVKNGKNAIGVILGNGRFMSVRIPWLRQFGTPQLIAQLEIETADGKHTIVTTDTSWRITANGPIGNNNEYDGEDYDASKEMPGWDKPGFDDSAWQQAESVAAPKGKLLAQANPNIRIMDTVKPRSISEIRPGVYILDMGQNMVGWLRFKLHGNEGDTLRMHFAETLKKDGNIYTANLRNAETAGTFVLNGKPAVWEPKFTYYGFRYVELKGFKHKPSLADIEGQVVYDEMAKTGTFTSSSNILNRIYKNAYWGIRGNYRGMPTDCPQRDERFGWLGDRAVGSQGESYMFDNHLLYAKWMRDIEETQRADSVISDIAPAYWEMYNDDVTWPAAWFTISDMLYRHFGDDRPIKENYDAMKRWMLHIKSRYMKDGIIVKDTYGDWCMPPESPELIHSKDPARKTDGALLSTAFYYELSKLMSKFARLSGHSADIAQWDALTQTTQKAFMKKFYNRKKGYFSNNTVTANILPLRYGMLDGEGNAAKQKVFDNIVKKTTGEFKSHVSTGLIGIQQLMRGLTDYGRGDLAYTIATNTTYPSWGYMIEKGATTIWELWNGDTADPAMNSGNHVMLLGDLIVWCYNYVAGIGQTPESIAYKQIRLQPRLIPGLSSAKATFDSPYGQIASSWKKTGDHLAWSFTIPCNTTAEVCVPANLKSVKGGKFLRHENGHSVFLFGSGTYAIEAETAK